MSLWSSESVNADCGSLAGGFAPVRVGVGVDHLFVCAYLKHGEQVADGVFSDFKRGRLVLSLAVDEGDGDKVVIKAEDSPVRFLFVSGMPIGEPVAWYGPIVMNTQEELQVAFEEFEKGTFIKHPA